MESFKILVVDDESIERQAIKFILNKEDGFSFEFFEAANGQEAISQAALYSPDIILMDIQMPGLNGLEAAKVIKKILEQSKIIFLTAYNQFEYAHEAIKLGVDDFIIKPATNERFIEVIKKTIRNINDEKEQHKNSEDMKSKLEQVTKYLENEFLTSLINGDIDEKQGNEYFKFNGITFHYGMGIVINTKVDTDLVSSNLRIQMLRKRFSERLDLQLMSIIKSKYSVILKDYIYILLLGKSQEELFDIQQRVREAIIETSELFESEHQLYTDFGIGDICNKLERLWKSFSTAKSSCNKRLPVKDALNEQHLKALVISIVDGDEEEFEKYIDLVFDDIVHVSDNIEQLKIKLYEEFILLKEQLSEKIFQVEMQTYDLFGLTMKLQNKQEGKNLLRGFCFDYFTRIHRQKTDKTVIVLDKLIAYINSHYAENITLEQLSSICSLSPTYISKVFKTHLNTNFIDYISSVRIRVAKRLIKNPDLSIKEISFELGYTDPNYFTRVFKKYEGLTPTEYRNELYAKDITALTDTTDKEGDSNS